MWTLWLALGLAVASAAPQEAFRQVLESQAGVTEEIFILSLFSNSGLEVVNIFNDTSLEVPTTTFTVLQEQDEQATTVSSKEIELKSNQDVIEEAETSTLGPNSITIDYPEELYLPDEDPIDNTIDDTLGSDDILDVIRNFIAEQDPMLQLFLSICFIHPTCYELDSPSPILNPDTMSSRSPLSNQLAENLSARRTETARNMLVDEVMKVQKQIKGLMFKYIQEGVGARGVSILATKTIIDSIKNIWLSLNSDLEYAKSSIQELFYLLPLDTKEQVQAMVEIAEVVQRIPEKTELLLQEATQEGYRQYVRSSSWDSWKRKGGE